MMISHSEIDEVIAIDSDVEKNGIARLNLVSKQLTTEKVSLPPLIEYIKENHSRIFVILEGGWLNKATNFHGGYGKGAEKIAQKVGRNHQRGLDIQEFLEYYKVKHKVKKPLRKVWKNGKISNLELNMLLRANNFATIKRTNQDQRDAILLILSEIL